MNDKSLESILHEERVFPPREEFSATSRLRPDDVEALNAEAEADYEGFWARLAREEIHWEHAVHPDAGCLGRAQLSLVLRRPTERFP